MPPYLFSIKVFFRMTEEICQQNEQTISELIFINQTNEFIICLLLTEKALYQDKREEFRKFVMNLKRKSGSLYFFYPIAFQLAFLS